jgi:hypothetical protein
MLLEYPVDGSPVVLGSLEPIRLGLNECNMWGGGSSTLRFLLTIGGFV